MSLVSGNNHYVNNVNNNYNNNDGYYYCNIEKSSKYSMHWRVVYKTSVQAD